MSLHWPTSIIFCTQDWSFRTSYPRKVVEPADIVCWGKRFSPQTLGLLQVLFLYRTSPEAYDLLAVVPSLWHLWRMGWTVLMWKDSLCHYHARYVNMECLQGSHCVPNLFFSCLYYSILLLQLSGSSSETIVDTFWWTSHNKLDSSSAGVSRFGAGADGILCLVGLQSSVFISWKVALSPPCGVQNSVMQNNGIGIQVLPTDKHLKKLIRILRILRISFSPQVFLRSHSF